MTQIALSGPSFSPGKWISLYPKMGTTSASSSMSEEIAAMLHPHILNISAPLVVTLTMEQ